MKPEQRIILIVGLLVVLGLLANPAMYVIADNGEFVQMGSMFELAGWNIADKCMVDVGRMLRSVGIVATLTLSAVLVSPFIRAQLEENNVK
jgi:hypothetical protein